MADIGMRGSGRALLPHLSPRRYFFALTVPPGFRNREDGRAVLRRYHLTVLALIAVTVILSAVLAERAPDAVLSVAPIALLIGGLWAYLRERNYVRRFASSTPVEHEVELSTQPEHLPWWVALAIPPFLAPLATALYLEAHWNEIPQRFAVHFGGSGVPNGWADKTARGVYGPLLFSAGMLLLMLLLALATFYGSRRGPQRLGVLKILFGTMYFLALVFSTVGLTPLVKISPLIFIIPMPLLVLGVLIWSFKMVQDMPAEATPDECWHLGGIYYNPHDAAIFVQKRIGFGYTINFANRWAWIILGGFFLGVFGLMFLMPWSK